MEILAALDDRLACIQFFYFTASAPFEALLRKYIPRYGTDGATPDEFESEKWKEAHEGRETLASCCLMLVSKAIHDYLLYFIMREVGTSKPDDVSALKLKGDGTFKKYETFLLQRTTFSWEKSPIGRDQVEQIILFRHDFIHNPAIDGGQTKQVHSPKSSRFIDPLDQAVREAMKTSAKNPAFAEIIAELGERAVIPEEPLVDRDARPVQRHGRCQTILRIC